MVYSDVRILGYWSTRVSDYKDIGELRNMSGTGTSDYWAVGVPRCSVELAGHWVVVTLGDRGTGCSSMM